MTFFIVHTSLKFLMSSRRVKSVKSVKSASKKADDKSKKSQATSSQKSKLKVTAEFDNSTNLDETYDEESDEESESQPDETPQKKEPPLSQLHNLLNKWMKKKEKALQDLEKIDDKIQEYRIRISKANKSYYFA